MAYCKHCGAPLEDNVKFCATCGTPVDGAPIIRTADTTDQFDAADIADNKYLAIFCYLGFVAMLLPLVAKPNSAFIKYHANQGLVLQVFCIALAIVCIIPILGWLVAFVGGIFAIVLFIMGIVHCCQGRAVELPLIGRIRIIR